MSELSSIHHFEVHGHLTIMDPKDFYILKYRLFRQDPRFGNQVNTTGLVYLKISWNKYLQSTKLITNIISQM